MRAYVYERDWKAPFQSLRNEAGASIPYTLSDKRVNLMHSLKQVSKRVDFSTGLLTTADRAKEHPSDPVKTASVLPCSEQRMAF